MKKIVIIFFCLFSLIGLGIKQEIRHEEKITTDKRVSLGPIIIYNYKDYSQIEARQKELESKSIEEARKTMSPEEFGKWQPWMENVIRCTDCVATKKTYGFPFAYLVFYSGFSTDYLNPFNLSFLVFNIIIYFVLAFLVSKIISLFNKKVPSIPL